MSGFFANSSDNKGNPSDSWQELTLYSIKGHI